MTLKEIIEQAVRKTEAMGVPATRSRLAELMGVSRTVVSQWALGQAFPNAVNIQRLAELAGLSVAEADEAVWQARRSRYDRRYRRPDVASSRLRPGLAKAHGRLRANHGARLAASGGSR